MLSIHSFLQPKTRLLALVVFFCFYFSNCVYAQKIRNKNNPVYVDKTGIMRWSKNGQEVSFFGVNYTVPFAYGYRSHRALGVDIEKAIEDDVYHFARLGLNAFRVHVWDTEISDSLGNLFDNDHLRLYDYLVFQLKKRGIKIFVTPIAFWGNGYPDRDERTKGFSSIYNKRQAVTNEAAFRAQENYLMQFFRHINPYTNQSYGNDPDVIAVEINNEPHHSGPKERTTEYVNRMAKAIRSTGWSKPVFYNISESPTYADAVSKAAIDGVSFQWYPTALVANHTQQGNFLPHVDNYRIPFDTIPLFAGKARMVYEFDAGDINQSYMYPAMARSFRTAGFQWATQFAYDPMATAYANTEYQTHYLNLAYAPSKAISLMIAAKAFQSIPRLANYGGYPNDAMFGTFRVSYDQSLSEMNTNESFYYSNSTTTNPILVSSLEHIAGVGSSPVIDYEGYGAYFLDKLQDGIWRLEVMPDAIQVHDPFEKTSLKKEVTHIQWQEQSMGIQLPDLSNNFAIKALNKGNEISIDVSNGKFKIYPGSYLVIRAGSSADKFSAEAGMGNIILSEFVAPKHSVEDPMLAHAPYPEVSSGKAFSIEATITQIDTADKILLEIHRHWGQFKTIVMDRKDAYRFEAPVPLDLALPGILRYRIIIQKMNGEYISFPGKHKGNPYAWDKNFDETWQTYVADEKGLLEIFNAGIDADITLYYSDRTNNRTQYITGEKPRQAILNMKKSGSNDKELMGFQFYFKDKLAGRFSELENFDTLYIKARAGNHEPLRIKATIINGQAMAFSQYITITGNAQNISMPLDQFRPDSMILLPRPYPGFMPLWFKSHQSSVFDLKKAEMFQVMVEKQPSSKSDVLSIEVESLWLKKK